MRNLRSLLREADEDSADPFSVEGTGWFGITSIPTTKTVAAKFPTALKPRDGQEEESEPEPQRDAPEPEAASVAGSEPDEDVEDVVASFTYPQASETAAVVDTAPAPPAAPSAPAPEDDVDDGVVTSFTFSPAKEPETAAGATQEPAQAQTSSPAPEPAAPAAAPPGAPAAPADAPTPADEKPADAAVPGPVAPAAAQGGTGGDGATPAPAATSSEPIREAASIPCAEIQKLPDYKMWDLLSFQDPDSDKYLIARQVRLGFDSRPPSQYQIENFRGVFDAMGVKCLVQYPGQKLMLATLMTAGSAGKTVLNLTRNSQATAFDGLCMFVECILSRELKQNGFYP